MKVSCVGWAHLNDGIFTCISATLSSGRVGFTGASGLSEFHGGAWRRETPNAQCMWVYLGKTKHQCSRTRHQCSRTFAICCTLESWPAKRGEDREAGSWRTQLREEARFHQLSGCSGPARGVCAAATGQGFVFLYKPAQEVMARGLRVTQASTSVVELYLICYHLRPVSPPDVGGRLRIFVCLCFQLKNIFLYRFYHLAFFWASETLSTSCGRAFRALWLFCPGENRETGYQCAGLLTADITKALGSAPHHLCITHLLTSRDKNAFKTVKSYSSRLRTQDSFI